MMYAACIYGIFLVLASLRWRFGFMLRVMRIDLGVVDLKRAMVHEH